VSQQFIIIFVIIIIIVIIICTKSTTINLQQTALQAYLFDAFIHLFTSVVTQSNDTKAVNMARRNWQ